MEPDDVPPGFWQWPDARSARIDGVELDSEVPTRFFQTIDAFPPEWGRLFWRIQLNKIEVGRATSPVFRTFYPGVEWNLNRPGARWFLTAWFRWEALGPPYRDLRREPALIEGDTALFRFSWAPKPMPLDSQDASCEPDHDRPIFLRSRVDARDRRRISEALGAHDEPAKPESAVISLDDIIEASR